MDQRELSQRRAERRVLKREHKAVFLEASALFYRFDPVGIGADMPSDEYEPEVGTILRRLRDCRDVGEVQDVVHEEFCRWFSSEIAGPRHRYTAVSVALWELWQDKHRSERDA
jgi:hypothetical protein